jgi:hypothetical protein
MMAQPVFGHRALEAGCFVVNAAAWRDADQQTME